MSDNKAAAERIAELEGHVEALKGCLERRSHELRMIIAHADPYTLQVISRVLRGLPATSGLARQLEEWSETTELRAAEVPETMIELWRSTAPTENSGAADD